MIAEDGPGWQKGIAAGTGRCSLLLSEDEVQTPAAAAVRAQPAQVAEQFRVRTAGFLQHIGQDGQAVKGLLFGNAFSQPPDGFIVRGSERARGWRRRLE